MTHHLSPYFFTEKQQLSLYQKRQHYIETLHQCGKRVKAKSQNVLEADSYFLKVKREELVGFPF